MGIVESAYNKVNNLPISEGLLAVSSIICGIIILAKLVKAVQDSSQEGQIDIRSFFKLFHSYIYMLMAIILAPMLFTMVETALGTMSDELTNFHQGAMNKSFEEVIKDYGNQLEVDIQNSNPITAGLMIAFSGVQIAVYTVIVYIEKFIYSIFMSSRYLYLIILKIVTPIAIVCSMHESTMDISKTYLRNLFYCYLMLPCFLIANNFAEALVEGLTSEGGDTPLLRYSIPMMLLRILLKMFLFGKAFQYAKQTI